ncbi:MAG: hypothetical protein ACRDQ5_23370, partial [Sciscionella sp.]
MTPSSDFDGQAERPEPTFADVLNGFSLDGNWRRCRLSDGEGEQPTEERAQAPPPAEEPQPEVPHYAPGARAPDVPQFGEVRYPVDELADAAAMVRPYAWTRGRTRASVYLRMETLVST